MAYELEVLPSAQRQLAQLDVAARKRCARALDGLAANPHPRGVKKLTDEEDLWRIRVGDYRILYQIDDERRSILVVGVGHRREVYR